MQCYFLTLSPRSDFFSYVAWLGAFVSCILFQGPEIYSTIKLRWQRKAAFNDKVIVPILVHPQNVLTLCLLHSSVKSFDNIQQYLSGGTPRCSSFLSSSSSRFPTLVYVRRPRQLLRNCTNPLPSQKRRTHSIGCLIIVLNLTVYVLPLFILSYRMVS